MTYRYRVTLPWSEVCMHMKVAGKQAEVEQRPGGMAQIYIDGEPFSFPVTRYEAGLTDDVINRHRYMDGVAQRVRDFIDRSTL